MSPYTLVPALSSSLYSPRVMLFSPARQAEVDPDLVISGSPPSTNEADNHESAFTIPICCEVCEPKPGSESAVGIRLTMGPRVLIYLMSVSTCVHFTFSTDVDPSFQRSQALVDSDGTLHTKFTVKLTRPMRSSFLSPSIGLSDTASQTPSALDAITTTTSSLSEPLRSPISNIRKTRARDLTEPVYATLRRGCRWTLMLEIL